MVGLAELGGLYGVSRAVLSLKATMGTFAALYPGVGWYWPHGSALLLQQASQACSHGQRRAPGEPTETPEA